MKNKQKIDDKSMQILNVKKKAPKYAKKMDLGESWARFGKGLGRSGPPFGHFWALLGRFLNVLNEDFFKYVSKMGSRRPFGLILDGFSKVLGRFWQGFGVDLGVQSTPFKGSVAWRSHSIFLQSPRQLR